MSLKYVLFFNEREEWVLNLVSDEVNLVIESTRLYNEWKCEAVICFAKFGEDTMEYIFDKDRLHIRRERDSLYDETYFCTAMVVSMLMVEADPNNWAFFYGNVFNCENDVISIVNAMCKKDVSYYTDGAFVSDSELVEKTMWSMANHVKSFLKNVKAKKIDNGFVDEMFESNSDFVGDSELVARTKRATVNNLKSFLEDTKESA